MACRMAGTAQLLGRALQVPSLLTWSACRVPCCAHKGPRGTSSCAYGCPRGTSIAFGLADLAVTARASSEDISRPCEIQKAVLGVFMLLHIFVQPARQAQKYSAVQSFANTP